MISHTYKCIFIHIPKNAGASIDTAFKEKHDHACHQHPLLYPEWKDAAYFKFTFSRNPYDRLVSAYHYLMKQCRTKTFWHQFIPYEKSFERFVTDFIAHLYTYPVYESSVYQHVRPQTYWMTDGYDFVGTVETIDDDFRYICTRLGLRTKKLKRRNKTRHHDFKQYYTEKTRDIVSQIYKDDFSCFRYPATF